MRYYKESWDTSVEVYYQGDDNDQVLALVHDFLLDEDFITEGESPEVITVPFTASYSINDEDSIDPSIARLAKRAAAYINDAQMALYEEQQVEPDVICTIRCNIIKSGNSHEVALYADIPDFSVYYPEVDTEPTPSETPVPFPEAPEGIVTAPEG